MKVRCSVFIATSLDGFISRTDGSIDWLNEANALVPPGEDCGFTGFLSTVDVLVMGRNTFQQVLSFPEWPYGQLPVVVLTHSQHSLPERLPVTVSVSSEEPRALVARLADRGVSHLYIDGGLTIQSFLQAGLIDELTITLIPVLLGAGRSLFGPLPQDLHLQLLASKAYSFGFVQNRYALARAPGQAL